MILEHMHVARDGIQDPACPECTRTVAPWLCTGTTDFFGCKKVLVNETQLDSVCILHLCRAVLASRWTDVTLEVLGLSIQICIEVSRVG